MYETEESKKSALLVFINQDKNELNKKAEIEEAISLVGNIKISTSATLSINLKIPNSYTYISSGSVILIKDYIASYEVDLVIFNTSLSPRAVKNLENELDICVIDREEVILQIFADRAQTREAKLQVELARTEYSLPRLTRRFTSLSQQRGGVKGSRGKGEQQLELDRRKAEKNIERLKEEIKKVQKNRSTQRKKRLNLFSFAIVGYTNAGKSTLLNALCKSDSYVENKLFATLDTTSRTINLNQIKVSLSDTVGFVTNLPHHLISAFSSTLEEVKLADCLIIVLDSSSLNIENEFQTTLEVLESLGCKDKEKIIVLNKIDNIENELSVEKIKITNPEVIKISAKNRLNLQFLLDKMKQKAEEKELIKSTTLDINDYDKLQKLYKTKRIKNVIYNENDITVDYYI